YGEERPASASQRRQKREERDMGPRAMAAALSILTTLVLGPITPVFAQQDWPSRTIKLIVPFAAGGNTDILGRLVADRIEKKFGAPTIVENRPGAGANIGAEAAAKSPGDGYTFF